MKGIFSYDGVIGQIMNKIIDTILLSFLWLLFSIPLFTMGAATTALYYTVTKVLRNEEGTMLKSFWSSFRMNFRQSTLIWIFYMIFYVVLVINGYYGYAFYSADVMPLGILIVIAVISSIVITWSCYIFPYIAKFNDSTKTVLTNSAYMMIRHFPWSLALLAVFVGSIVMFVSVPFGIAFMPVVCAFASSLILERIFRIYIPEETDSAS